MAIYALSMQVIGRGGQKGRSVVAAAAYRAGETLYDARQVRVHDYSRKQWVEHKEIMLPPEAPAWIQGIDRGTLWRCVDAIEKRKDSQCAREMWVSIPRELNKEQRIALVRDFVAANFTRYGMVGDVCLHAPPGQGGTNYHAHIMLTMRPLTDTGFGPKERHDRVLHPEGLLHPDGRPIYVDSRESWNSLAMLERTRVQWQDCANRALSAVGSEARIDHRSYLERGIAKVAEPYLGNVLFHMREVRGAMRDRFNQWSYARFARAVEQRAKAAFERPRSGTPPTADFMKTAKRFHDWFDRQIVHLGGREVPRADLDLWSSPER